MPGQSYDHIVRQMRRTIDIAKEALESEEPKMIGVKGLAPGVIAAAEGFLSAHDAVVRNTRLIEKEKGESEVSLETLRRVYQQLFHLAKFKGGFGGDVESAYATDDDFISAAEEMEQVFDENKDTEWGGQAFERLSTVIDDAAKEFTEFYTQRRDLQKAFKERLKAAEKARDVFVMFRQTVRSVFGRTSKEYKDLADKRYKNKPEQPE